MAFRKTLYEFRKGKQMQASGSWKTTPREDMIVKVVGVFFGVSAVAELLVSFLGIRSLILPVTICLAISFIGVFVVLFGLVYLKSRKEPMEKHYYDVDYEYNGIRDEMTDKTREISEEEFRNKKQ